MSCTDPQCVASEVEERCDVSSCGSSAVTRHVKQPCKAQRLDHLLNVCALTLNPQAPSRSLTCDSPSSVLLELQNVWLSP